MNSFIHSQAVPRSQAGVLDNSAPTCQHHDTDGDARLTDQCNDWNTEIMDEILLFYYLHTVNQIYSSSVDRIKKFNIWPPGPQFAHACTTWSTQAC